MVSSKFAPYYWQHKCPALSPQDGDDGSPVPRGQNLVSIRCDKIPFLGRLFFKEETILGKKCSVGNCTYVVNEETVLLNAKEKAIRNLGGKNLYKGRTTTDRMKCCGCGNTSTSGHSSGSAYDGPSSTLQGYGNHDCGHTIVYLRELRRGLNKRLKGCTCVMLNEFGEKLEYWEPYGATPDLYPGGPLDLDRKYHEKKKKKEVR